jgi:hypothetical protein
MSTSLKASSGSMCLCRFSHHVQYSYVNVLNYVCLNFHTVCPRGSQLHAIFVINIYNGFVLPFWKLLVSRVYSRNLFFLLSMGSSCRSLQLVPDVHQPQCHI